MSAYARVFVGALLFAPACAPIIPGEPALGQQLWEQRLCFAHELPEWRHLELGELGGTVITDGTAKPDALPESRVFARHWPAGPVLQTTTDVHGAFVFAEARDGTYEVAVCRDGWNPWRGTVLVSRKAKERNGTFPLLLGW